MTAHADAIQAMLDVKTDELEKAWQVIAELRRQLYICQVMRGLAEGRLEDELSAGVGVEKETKE